MTDPTNPSAGDQGNVADEKKIPDAGAPAGDEGTKQPNANDPNPDANKKADGDGGNGDEDFKDDGVEPPSRKKDVKDFIIQRKEEKIRRMEAAKKAPEKDDEGDDGQDDDDDDGQPDPKVAKKGSSEIDEDLIAKIIEKRFPQVKAMQDAELKAEITGFISKEGNEMFKPFADKITRFAQHPSRAHLPIEAVAYEVAGPHLIKLGIKMAEQAREKAGKSKTGGGSSPRAGAGSKGSIPDVNSMDLPTFQKWLKEQGQG